MRIVTSLTAVLLAYSTVLGAQEAQVLEVGQMAPEFELVGSTRFGVLQEPVRLSDFRGKTVVLAFYYRARTRG